METANERRKRKLQVLCDKHGRLAVATKAGVNPVALEQILKGVLLPEKADGTRSPRSLGDVAARAIEAAYKLGEGWFDAPDAAPTFSDEALALAATYEKMSPAERQLLQRLMLAASDEAPQQKARIRGTSIRGTSILGGLDDIPEVNRPEVKPKKKAI